MISGRLTKPVVLERTVWKPDGPTGDETRVCEQLRVRADVLFGSEARADASGAVYLRDTVTFAMWHYMSRIVGDYDTIVWENRRYQVESVEPDERAGMVYVKATRINE